MVSFIDELTAQQTQRLWEIYKMWCEQRMEKASIKGFLLWGERYQ